METELIIISQGMLLGGYHDSTIGNQYIRTYWDVAPVDGSPALPDGHYRGIFLGDDKMRILHGGEYYAGSMINQTCEDYFISFREKDNEEYREGFKRGYLGKRSTTWSRFEREGAMWREGYQSGRFYKLQSKRGAVFLDSVVGVGQYC